jgi:peptidoglycan/xylan/chitin deacetylase (PgdA/CDA1 family)
MAGDEYRIRGKAATDSNGRRPPNPIKSGHRFRSKAGHTIGSHPWSHADLSKLPADQAKDEIEKGVSAVRTALGQPAARQ